MSSREMAARATHLGSVGNWRPKMFCCPGAVSMGRNHGILRVQITEARRARKLGARRRSGVAFGRFQYVCRKWVYGAGEFFEREAGGKKGAGRVAAFKVAGW